MNLQWLVSNYPCSCLIIAPWHRLVRTSIICDCRGIPVPVQVLTQCCNKATYSSIYAVNNHTQSLELEIRSPRLLCSELVVGGRIYNIWFNWTVHIIEYRFIHHHHHPPIIQIKKIGSFFVLSPSLAEQQHIKVIKGMLFD